MISTYGLGKATPNRLQQGCDWMVARHIHAARSRDGIDFAVLADEVGIPPSTLSRCLRRLAATGIVTIIRSSTDGRKITVFPGPTPPTSIDVPPPNTAERVALARVAAEQGQS